MQNMVINQIISQLFNTFCNGEGVLHNVVKVVFIVFLLQIIVEITNFAKYINRNYGREDKL